MRYPLVYTYNNIFENDHWSALIVVSGRCLMEYEDGEWWLEAVEPGGFTGHDEEAALAIKDFRQTWTLILEDAAHGKRSFAEFRKELERIGRQITAPADREWREARIDLTKEGIAEPFASMPRITGEWNAGIRIYGSDKPKAAVHPKPNEFIPVEQTALNQLKYA